MSHSTTLYSDGDDQVVAIHNGDWSGPTLLRRVDVRGVETEFEVPSEALQALVDAVLAETVTEEERDLAARLFGLAKRRCQ
jgi:hypothetical protein